MTGLDDAAERAVALLALVAGQASYLPATPATATPPPALLADEGEPVEVLADAAYRGGQTRKDLRRRRAHPVIKPPPALPGGLDRDDFTVDHDARIGTCPAGETMAITIKRHATSGVRCPTCPLRDRSPPAGQDAH